LRRASGLTQAGWAAWLGYGRATVQRWEQGEAIPDASALQAIVAFCHEKGLFRSYSDGPLRGKTLTRDFLSESVADARLELNPVRRVDTPPVLVPLPPRARPASGNLRRSLSSFVGRERELREVEQHLDNTRLLTLVGPGGIGKTRLAIEVAANLGDDYPDGVLVAELSALTDAVDVPRAVWAALEIREEPDRSLEASLADRLADECRLLLLDNCEHVLTGCVELVTSLLQTCPHLRILATSRQALGCSGERVWRVPSLGTPDVNRLSNCPPEVAHAELLSWDSARLFVERASAVEPNFTLTTDVVVAVAQICRRLDGLPLALELAAARMSVLAAPQIVSLLDDSLRLLTGANSLAPKRQRTLRDTLDWSHDLLDASERACLRRLAVFAGGFSLAAAEAVCLDLDLDLDTTASSERPGDVLNLLAQLVAKSLVQAEVRGHEARYTMLESIRQYAAERLVAADEVVVTHASHAQWCLTFVAEATQHLRSANQLAWFDRLDLELDNVRAALRWCFQYPALADTGLRIAAALRVFWYARGQIGEGRGWLERGLRIDARLNPSVRAEALDVAAALAHNQGDYAVAGVELEESIELWRELGDRRGLMLSLNTLGIVAKDLGEHARATAFLEEALSLAQALRDRSREATTLLNLAAVASDTEHNERAKRLLENCLAIKRELGDEGGVATALHNLGDVAMHTGAYDRAEVLFEESLALSRRQSARDRIAHSLHGLAIVEVRRDQLVRAAGHARESLELFEAIASKLGVALCLEAWAELAQHSDEWERSTQLLSAAAAWRSQNGAPIAPNDRADTRRLVDRAREVLGESAFDATWTTGQRLTLQQAARSALDCAISA
jgi:predicted ATPase/transcriptional regulator with XRE-family HTH domain/Tfp pilus assembly protein PilF